MEQDRISQVRQRAHAIWIEQGQPEGAADQHWAQAEAEFAAEAPVTTTPLAESADAAVAEPEAAEEPAPLVEPDVVATPEPAAAAPAPAKKTVKRKVKPLTPIR